ncbi:MAG: hypothetical protein L6420_08875 [Elusimicrobia bacterium]|nr:hypothetical protein [Elusimicrobiota bacterium]
MKYWAYINNEILGPYEKDKLFEISDFNPTTLICPQTPVGEKTEDWKEAAAYPEISAVLNSPKNACLKKEEDTPRELNINKDANEENDEKNNREDKALSLNQLKPQPLSAFPVNAENPSSIAPHDNFKVNKLSSIKKDEEKKETRKQEEEPAKEESGAAPDEALKSADSNFDQITLSQINRKTLAGMNTQENTAQKEKKQKSTPTTEVPATPAETESGIYSKLNELSQNSISKSDLLGYMEPINNKLSQIDKTVSDLGNAKLANEIKEMSGKLKHMENVIDEIKLNMSIEKKPVKNIVQKKEVLKESEFQQGFSVMGDEEEPEKTKETAEDIARAIAKEKDKIIDEGEKSDKKLKKTSLVKALVKPLMTIVLLAAILVASAIALKQAGIIDLAKMLPFAYFNGEQTQTDNISSVSQAIEEKPPQIQEQPDISPEIIFFTRTYSNKTGTKTIENQIISAADKMKGDTNLIEWQAIKIAEGIYTVNASVPVTSAHSKIDYNFETDYIKKTIKPLNAQAKNILDNLFEIIKPKKKAIKTARTNRASKKPEPNTKKPIVEKQVIEDDDEYEYVYEDEEDSEQYIMPGMPTLGD